MRLTRATTSILPSTEMDQAAGLRAAVERQVRCPVVKVTVSATEPDWSRERLSVHGIGEPSRRLLRTIRGYQHWLSNPRKQHDGIIGKLMHRYFAMRWRFWSTITGADIPLNCQIGGGLLLPHPNGVVIHPSARLGPNCLVFQGVTIGNTRIDGGCPEISGHVDFGAGAKVLGRVRIGPHARIGPNCVIIEGHLDEIPAGATVMGNPGQIVSVAVIEEVSESPAIHR